ncbi:CGNR zinc finger domain-containing protein [Sinomonas sp. JGH33]|uniref:CGNR zinc finger domain-containing protein n=1 Tax=Sinomonas terricola TaxID=3110330 RepID=A0ABU5T742_9MICC|nr:CGNR zinc finger domain-containing protein [Sinomonas sp. JGH33]MEA5454941.1 CGNR zinc finger domain-containing protein [Sinomonas sp. JGH33]
MERDTETSEACPIDALFDLASSSPRILGFEGLHRAHQIDQIAIRAGLRLPRELSLEELYAPDAGGDRARDEGPADPCFCPLPMSSDLAPVSHLREILCEALFDDFGRPLDVDRDQGHRLNRARDGLTQAALDYGLSPALTALGLVVQTTREDVTGRVASKLIPAAMGLLADGLMTRVRRCAEPWCRAPFFDHSRNARAQFCSQLCAARVRKRRERAAA